MRVRATSIILVLLVALAAVSAAGAFEEGTQVHHCAGRVATVVGTPAEEVIKGTPHRDVIWVGPGNHLVLAGAGNDVICAGPGEDTIHGEAGNDLIFGGAGHDTIYGEAGNDTVHGRSGSDVIYGGRGDDDLVGGRAGGNVIYGGAGDDQLNGGRGDDNILHGGLGIDVLRGGGGNGDILDGGYGWDIIDGGSGHDNTATFATMPRSEERKDGGVWASLKTGRAYGDGHDKLRRIENLEGSAFDDTLIGNRHANKLYGGPGSDRLIGGGHDLLDGGLGSDRCRGASRQRRISCGHELTARAPTDVYFESGIDPAAAGVVIASGAGNEDISVALDAATDTLGITSNTAIAANAPCTRPAGSPKEASCPLGGVPRWLTADLGRGNDHFRVIGSLEGLGEVRVDGGPGNDVLRGGPEEDLFQGGPGADRLYGGAGDDALVGEEGGPDLIDGGPGGDLLAAGSACEGGRLVGGSGRNDASFAEMSIQPGILYASLARGIAYVKGEPGCHPLRISGAQDLEGTMGSDLLIGDSQGNHIIGQGGVDEIFGRGGEDVIEARNGVADAIIQCGTKGHPAGTALIDPVDPRPRYCKKVEVGKPIPGFPHFHPPDLFGP